MTKLKPIKTGLVSAALAALAMSGCAQPNGGRPAGVTQAQAQACQQRADEIYRVQNRGEIYRNDSFATSTLDSPFSSNGLTTSPTGSLGDQYGREKDLQACYNNSAPGSADDPMVQPVHP